VAHRLLLWIVGAIMFVAALSVALPSRGQEFGQPPQVVHFVRLGCLDADAAIVLLVTPDGPEFQNAMLTMLQKKRCFLFDPVLPVECDARPIEADLEEGVIVRYRTFGDRTLLFSFSTRIVAAEHEVACGPSLDKPA